MKESKIICRVTNNQREVLEQEARKNNVSISEMIRIKLDSNHYSNIVCSRNNARKLCSVLTEIQRLKLEYPQVNFEQMEERMEEVWQELM